MIATVLTTKLRAVFSRHLQRIRPRRVVPNFPVEGHIFWIVCLVTFVSVFRIECLAESLCVCVFRIVCLLAFMNVFVYCLLIYVIFLCVNAGMFILNMMDHKWSAHDISSTHVKRTAS